MAPLKDIGHMGVKNVKKKKKKTLEKIREKM